jgi:hypothetical protein
VDSISNQSHALDFGRELQKLHKKRFSRKCMLTEKIYPPKTRGSEKEEQPEKEEHMVEERTKRSRTRSRTGARGVGRSGSLTLDARSSTS